MSRGNDSRTGNGREASGRNEGGMRAGKGERNSRSSIAMTVERAQAIQAHADRTGTNRDFKARAMSAADQNTRDTTEDE